jgi:arylsulfatase A-like enzyme
MLAVRSLIPLALILGPSISLLAQSRSEQEHNRGRENQRPNILFVILDDVGIDQYDLFNPTGSTALHAPALTAVAAGGVKFTNFHTMPECSPSRVCFFTGRFPLRTGVRAALLDTDQPRSQLSAYEVTTPMILKRANYTSALIGKYHLGGPANNPFGNAAPRAMGWDYFDGILAGACPPVDPTLGGQYTEDRTRYGWGFPAGSQLGVGWFLNADGTIRLDDNQGSGYTGKQIVALGGIPALDASGNFAATQQAARTSGRTVSFTNPGAVYNGYYSWPHTTNTRDAVTTDVVRSYAPTVQTDTAVSWIRSQSGRNNKPWMCTVGYSSIHTPYQMPPDHLYPPGFVWPSGVPQDDAANPDTIKVVSDLMLYALDQEFGRLLVETGIAGRSAGGQLVYNPAASNTMIVLVSDNGTFTQSVKPPYNALRAKGSAYQSGILNPMVIAGPMVQAPGRTVDALTSCVDLFELFGEVAGVDVRREVPTSHVLDSKPMLGYLTNPQQRSYRDTLYSELGPGLKIPSQPTYATAVSVFIGGLTAYVCTDKLFTSESLAEANGGVWYGPGAPVVYSSCCDLRAAGVYQSMSILPTRAYAIRNDRFKLIKFERAPCDADLGEYEFYDLRPTPLNPINPLGLDNQFANLLDNGQVPAAWSCGGPLSNPVFCERLTNYRELMAQMNAIFASERFVEGDGNLDKRVTSEDLAGARRFFGQPSWFDFNNDGTTDNLDLQIIRDNLGRR